LNDITPYYSWKHLLLFYSSFFPLTQDHIFNLPVKPSGIWHLRDLTPTSFCQFFDLINKNSPVHSQRISKRLQLPLIKLNTTTQFLLNQLAQGKRTEEICITMGLSKSTIERHKRQLKERLGIEHATDCGLFFILIQYEYSFFKIDSFK
tara:strand:- start:1588 stop:2034 length:447 start_codon:yes stop_codon:yes gene_type:complete